MPHQRRKTEKPQAALVTLTPREKEVLRLLTEGLSNKAIARKLVISDHTVETHLCRIYKKFYVRNRTSAAIFAILNGIISKT